ncbi:MAG: aminotransferase class III-fold pyridoxal phosphate-dependent enzyme [Rubrivivax sp.]|nr:aminotransferase class III-fold pyridoxal phosphate-dependent enzyme [Rubrivivax sp.]
MQITLTLTTLAAAALLGLGYGAARRRLALSRAKHRSLAGHSRIAKWLARQVPGYAYDEAAFFAADGAPADVREARRAGLRALADLYAERFPQTLALTREMRGALPDLAMTGRYRVPFQFSPQLARHLSVGAFVRAASGVTVEDLDGNRLIDLTGSYGVNLFGVDFYKQCIAEAQRMAEPLGPVLGAYHPCVADNVRRLQRISGHEAVSFHMSGTEAVMQAVRLARYHTGRKYLVRFAGAYHGWWEDVQPGPGNPMPPRETYTLKDMDERSLQVLRTRGDIACVLVNPLQALHPNRNAPADSSLVGARAVAGFDRAAYKGWLRRLREVCSERGIVLIFDEVFVGFRLAPGGAQEAFGVSADLVTYGKTLGGGLPVGVVCGREALMRRYREDRPADLCFARGTFNAHPYVMAAMNVFLRRLDTPQVRALYEGADERWNAHAAELNHRLEHAGLPVRVAHLGTIWTVSYTQPSRYHWLLQFYLRAQGLALSWVGTGRLIFGLHFDEADFDEVCERFVAAALQMRADGWWWRDPARDTAAFAKHLRWRLLGEMVRHRLPSWSGDRRGPAGAEGGEAGPVGT